MTRDWIFVPVIVQVLMTLLIGITRAGVIFETATDVTPKYCGLVRRSQMDVARLQGPFEETT